MSDALNIWVRTRRIANNIFSYRHYWNIFPHIIATDLPDSPELIHLQANFKMEMRERRMNCILLEQWRWFLCQGPSFDINKTGKSHFSGILTGIKEVCLPNLSFSTFSQSIYDFAVREQSVLMCLSLEFRLCLTRFWSWRYCAMSSASLFLLVS